MTPLDPEALFDALAESEIEYILVGGFAVGAHGAIRATKDLDICPNPDEGNLRRLAALLVDLDCELVDLVEFQDEHDLNPDLAGLQGGGNFRLVTKFGGLDVMQHLDPFEDDTWGALEKNAEGRELDGCRIRVCGYEDLLKMKQAAGREQDLADVRNLKAARREL